MIAKTIWEPLCAHAKYGNFDALIYYFPHQPLLPQNL